MLSNDYLSSKTNPNFVTIVSEKGKKGMSTVSSLESCIRAFRSNPYDVKSKKQYIEQLSNLHLKTHQEPTDLFGKDSYLVSARKIAQEINIFEFLVPLARKVVHKEEEFQAAVLQKKSFEECYKEFWTSYRDFAIACNEISKTIKYYENIAQSLIKKNPYFKERLKHKELETSLDLRDAGILQLLIDRDSNELPELFEPLENQIGILKNDYSRENAQRCLDAILDVERHSKESYDLFIKISTLGHKIEQDKFDSVLKSIYSMSIS